MKTVCLGKIWFWTYIQKWLSANEISLFFNRQYFITRLISDFDLWHVDRHEWTEQGFINRFPEKILIWANEPFWAQKWHILITLDLQEEFFKNFTQWKGSIVRWKWYYFFPKNYLFGANGPCWAQKRRILITLGPL